MSKHKEKILQNLARFLYGEQKGFEFLTKVFELIQKEFSSKNSKSYLTNIKKKDKHSVLSEKTAVLICYADSLYKNIIPNDNKNDLKKTKTITKIKNYSLKVLSSFLNQYAKKTFSHIHILPFFPYSSDDGFSIIDYRSVRPDLGTWENVQELSQNFSIIADIVINHTSASCPWFQAFLQDKAPYSSWYLSRPKKYDTSTIIRPRTHPLLTAFKKTNGKTIHVWTTFSSDQVDLNFESYDVFLEFLSIIFFYIKKGIKILRLDAVAYLWKEDNTPCIHHPKTHAAIQFIRALIDYLKLDVLLLSETNVPHLENISYFGKSNEAQIIYNFALPPLVLHAAISADASPLTCWAKQVSKPPKNCYYLNFLSSHDGIGLTPAKDFITDKDLKKTLKIAVQRGAKVSYKATPSGSVPYELNTTFLSAITDKQNNYNKARIFLTAHALMLSLAGIPAIYIHSWLGSENWQEGVKLLGYNRAINRKKLDVRTVQDMLNKKDSLNALIFTGLKKLFTFRAKYKAFAPSSPQKILTTPKEVFALIRGPDTKGISILCISNFSNKCIKFNLTINNSPKHFTLPKHAKLWQAFNTHNIIEELT